MRKSTNRPQQPLYKPGSGPLRKTEHTLDQESTMDEGNLAANRLSRIKAETQQQSDDMDARSAISNDRRRSKKPEQQIYVPAAVVKARESERRIQSDVDVNFNGSKSKQQETRHRFHRQASESRLDQQQQQYSTKNWGRGGRDSKSVEANYNRRGNPPPAKAKPPTGRRHSTIGDEQQDRRFKSQQKLDNLPPRFRKMRQDEIRNTQVNEECWDGAGATFQKRSEEQGGKKSKDVMNNARGGGGRGRSGNETPEKVNDNIPSQCNKNCAEGVISGEKLSEKLATISVSNDKDVSLVYTEKLDWSEEVELYSNLLEEKNSDGLTRSSSMTSISEQLPKTKSHKKRRSSRKKRDQRIRSGDKERRNASMGEKSISRESSPRRIPEKKALNSRNDPRWTRLQPSTTRDRSLERWQPARNSSRESKLFSGDDGGQMNWRDEIRARTTEIERPHSNSQEVDNHTSRRGGIIHLPREPAKPPSLSLREQPSAGDIRRPSSAQRTLYDPQNPRKPIIINKPNSRVSSSSYADPAQVQSNIYTAESTSGRPIWQHELSDNFKSSHHPKLLKDIRTVDMEMQRFTSAHIVIQQWDYFVECRTFLKEALVFLLLEDMKFAELENVEQYFWKMIYHNCIEMMRTSMRQEPENAKQYKDFLLPLVDEGIDFYEHLLQVLQRKYNFKVANFTGIHADSKSSGMITLALVSSQKIYLCLGDLYRYKENINETTNYGKSRQQYLKAHEINPKNGRPYNQLAMLAFNSKKKLDAVYYYMRSHMSTNPISSAWLGLITILDENRKKYLQQMYFESERKKREERLEKARLHMKQKESESTKGKHGSLRKETWIRPDGGRRLHLTTSTLQETLSFDSEEEDLAALSSAEVNKRFVTSYLHVHSKLITKIGMESFQEAALQMLKEFRALLQHSPIPLPSSRFLQLLALNMFAINSTKLKDPELQQPGYRSELQERALTVSLEMFSLILEKCVLILADYFAANANPCITTLPQDVHELLPSVKIWCDWMLYHNRIWNPPPSTQDYKVGPSGDTWSRIATLMNLLERLNHTAVIELIEEPKIGFELVRLPEDNALSGFTPLMCGQFVAYAPVGSDLEVAQCALRLNRLLFFGTEFLCGVDPPVLKLEYGNDASEYISVVCTTANRSASNTPPELAEKELLLESFSDEEDSTSGIVALQNTSNEIQELLSRKVELERRQRDQELHRKAVQKILERSVVSVHIEVKPKSLVPDTNCFVDYLPQLMKIAASNVYTLMVPLIVLNELEGLAKGANTSERILNQSHALKVAAASKTALEFLGGRPNGVKCITTKGTVLPSAAFTKEDDSAMEANATNDDRILLSCLSICKSPQQQQEDEEGGEQDASGPRKIHRDVVLLTEDRNLRVKALARDVPVRDLPKFLQWAGLS